ncbi:hypothetical protein SAMN04487897_101131 [Paenibacillus sp. yr247]|uniref:hypothetical protein n=1 Tax=Paenibacillus sp. yr247 TaxID=1761880 RepID=UPI0008923147|nr:hypothetical protein [Paenibacillus sp. yr247]SDM81426.1 hypothetical protein SAMN04487897_101131 [Paenibacillus sp. yr247]
MKKLVYISAILVTLTCFNVHAVLAFDGAEVFDIQKGEVVKTLKHSAKFAK